MTVDEDRREWSDPGVYPVARDVYRIPLPLPNDGLRAVSVYVVIGEDGLACIDSGWSVPEARGLFVRMLASLDVAPSDIERFFVTHMHRDHYTQAVALRREFGTTVALGRGEQPSLALVRDPTLNPFRRRLEELRRNGAHDVAASLVRIRATQEPPSMSEWELPDQWLRDGEKVRAGDRTLEVLETPGHTRGHVVFHDAQDRLLFAGDHVLPTITPSIGFEPAPSVNPLGNFLTSLARIRELPDARVLPAHGPVVESAHARVDELVAHHGVRLGQSLAAVAAGADTAADVATCLRWTRRERTFDELDPFNQSLAVSETVAHLRLLEAQGRLKRTSDEGVDRYQPG